jgi:signal transduction histidine kinase/CheY-like chemotaxis protein/HPt (histidine-containing phosphotransfer) domain-containing protein
MTEDLFAPLDLAMFERRADGLFEPVGRMPDWLPISSSPVDLNDSFPVLEMLVAECGEEWKGHSGVWTEPDPRGGELYLQAIAAALADRRFIALRSLPQEFFALQQTAHDKELERHQIERLNRALEIKTQEAERLNRELEISNHELEIKKQEAEQATQAKSSFLAAMSHEIRTPLNAIIGMADVLNATPLSSDQQKCVDVFQRNGLSLLSLINEILDLSKIEAGRVELEAIEMDLREVIERAMEVVEVRVKAKALSLRQVIAPGVPLQLIGDPNRLRQIIINLLGNSIKFTDQGGLEVRVDLDPDDPRPGRLRFAISDTGIGIPKDKLGSIFESFSQADSSTTRKYGGTGLGLTISKQLVELMDGRIWPESEVGVGSVFFFTAGFQVQANQSAKEKKTEASAPIEDLEARVSGLRILLADDFDDNRYLIRSYLKHSQVEIEIAENGEIAARVFRGGHFDVVLMDVEMPVMDGYQATAEIRRFEKETGAPATPVLALTANAFKDVKARGLEAGFTDVLTKPIRKATLLEKLVEHGAKQSTVSRTGSATVEAELPRTSEKNLIQVEEGMEDVVPRYLEKRRADVPVYNEALAKDDFESIRQLAHKMKGTGTGYGFPGLTELGGTMEKGAIERDAAQIRESLKRLALYLDSIELKYIGE